MTDTSNNFYDFLARNDFRKTDTHIRTYVNRKRVHSINGEREIIKRFSFPSTRSLNKQTLSVNGKSDNFSLLETFWLSVSQSFVPNNEIAFAAWTLRKKTACPAGHIRILSYQLHGEEEFGSFFTQNSPDPYFKSEKRFGPYAR